MRFLPIPLAILAAVGHGADVDWPNYLGDKASSHYSTLEDITPENVAQLEIAWTYHSGDAREDNRSQIQCNPLVIDGVLYGTSAKLKLFALDAATGRELWRFDPFADSPDGAPVGLNRGVAYWQDGDDRRVMFGVSRYLYAIDAASGVPVSSFGEAGRIDLKQGLGRDTEKLGLVSTSPGAIFKNLIIMPMRLGEGPAPAAPGHIRAFDVRTGELVWRFNTIPQPGEFGYETWSADSYEHIGGANVWTGMTIDEERGMVFCPTGSAAFDFWGGERIGENLFANCLIALDAATGKRIWHYQFVRHDVWDRDLPAPPNLMTVKRDGKDVPAIAQVTKSGHVFIFHRETGEPLFPMEEVATPPSDLVGEKTWPTQPLSVLPKPFARQVFSAEQINDVDSETYQEVMTRFVKLRPHMPFMPPSVEGTIIYPGFDGGAEWGGAAVDPEGVLYINSSEMPWVLTMVDATKSSSPGEAHYLQNCAGCHGQDRAGTVGLNVPTLIGIQDRMTAEQVGDRIKAGAGFMPPFGHFTTKELTDLVGYLTASESATSKPVAPPSVGRQLRYTHTGYHKWITGKGYPAVKPPWGTLHAIDMNSGDYRWSVTLGEVPELVERGLPPTGTENYGGPIVTAGGVLFIAASKDEHIRAFDTRSGIELWKDRLPAGGYATPSTYRLNGKQYVVIACGGGKMGTPSGDAYVAFALPE